MLCQLLGGTSCQVLQCSPSSASSSTTTGSLPSLGHTSDYLANTPTGLPQGLIPLFPFLTGNPEWLVARVPQPVPLLYAVRGQ